jgi:co-chaperonin GroES (HSP10)
VKRETAKGLVLPDNTKLQDLPEVQRCLVIAVGPDCKWVKEGDEVITYNDAMAMRHCGNMTVLLREEHITGIVLEEFRAHPRPAV